MPEIVRQVAAEIEDPAERKSIEIPGGYRRKH